MIRKSKTELVDKEKEGRKRKREILIAISLAVIFVFLTFIEVRLTYLSRELPFMHSIFFFGLVNFNIVLLLFLAFLVFRNIVKTFVEQSGKIIGNSLKSKLIAAFVAFSFVPTVLMFLISVFYINSSFEKWFSIKTASVLRDSLEITNAYYLNSKQKNYHFANQIVDKLGASSFNKIKKSLDSYRQLYSLDIVEFYPALMGDRVLVVSDIKKMPDIPKVSLEFLEKGMSQGTDSSTIHHFKEGSLVRVIAPMKYATSSGIKNGALVVSSYIPISLISKMDEIATAYESFRDVNPLVYPIKTIYLVILCLMTMVILLGATWFGFYLAKQLATPLGLLGEAADQIAEGHYDPVDIQTGSQEINQLIRNFNHMTSSLADSEKEILEVNKNLKSTLDILDEHNRYIEFILSSVSTGVVSIDPSGVITTLNPRAAELLKIVPDRFIGKKIIDVLPSIYRDSYIETLSQMKQNGIRSIQKELRIQVQQESLLMKLTISVLEDESGKDLGVIVVFDDLTELMNAQRAAAWREVARRIAHEIKNPLTPIKLSAQRLEKKFGSTVQDPAFQACTEMIIKQVDDLKNLVNEFSSFARLPQINPKKGSIEKLIKDLLVLYSTGHKDVVFDFKMESDIPQFEFDSEQIGRVLTNMLENSVMALKDVQDPRVDIVVNYDSSLGIVRIRIKDNGCGIESSMRDRVFEPYFSTKEGGTGLGLAIVKRIIEDHHGFIRAFGNKPQGTEFVIELPVVKSGKDNLSDKGGSRPEKESFKRES